MKNSPTAKRLDRRQFLKVAGAAVILPTILPGCVMGRGGKTAPSNKIALGVIGMGWQGPSNTQSFLAENRLPGGGGVRSGRQPFAGCLEHGQ